MAELHNLRRLYAHGLPQSDGHTCRLPGLGGAACNDSSLGSRRTPQRGGVHAGGENTMCLFPFLGSGPSLAFVPPAVRVRVLFGLCFVGSPPMCSPRGVIIFPFPQHYNSLWLERVGTSSYL